VWRLTMTIARRYMHTMEMKKQKFIKNKLLEVIVKKCVEKVTLILFTHVAQPTFENSGAWVVWSQRRVNVTHQMRYPFVWYACCTCVGIVREFMQTLDCGYFHMHWYYPRDIIEYCGTWYGSKHEELIALFVNSWHIPNDGHYEKSCFFKKFNLSKVSTLTKRMFVLTKKMGHEKHIVFLVGFFY